MTAGQQGCDLASGGGDRTIELWLVDRDRLAGPLAGIDAHWHILPPDELARAAAMSTATDAMRWRRGRIALRLILAARSGPDTARSSFALMSGGRPALPAGTLDFSLSDAGSMLLIGLSCAGRIGVDIEVPRTLEMSPKRIARLIAAADGLAGTSDNAVHSTSPLQAWTRIEAFAKATAPSLASCLSALGTAGHAGHPSSLEELRARAEDVRNQAGILVRDLTLADGLRGAVAVPSAVEHVPAVRQLDEADLRAFADQASR